MARIVGVDVPDNKRLVIGLTYIFGIGPSVAKRIIQELDLNEDTKVKALSEDDIFKLQTHITENFRVEGDLRRELTQHVKRLIDIGSYRGLRHRKGLPVRGQRTKTNARTRKGPAKTVARSKKAAERK
jgi:small subunit ribosomal protein S13